MLGKITLPPFLDLITTKSTMPMRVMIFSNFQTFPPCKSHLPWDVTLEHGTRLGKEAMQALEGVKAGDGAEDVGGEIRGIVAAALGD